MKTMVILAVITLAIALSTVHAGVTCAEIKYGSPTYSDKMDELARLARLPDNYWNKYHESIVSDICAGRQAEVKKAIDLGFVKSSEAEAIRRNLEGHRLSGPVQQRRSEDGKSYGYSREKFSDMGLCSACADNVAQWYTKRPNSRCGKLAKQALEGNPDAEQLLATFPSYCQWQY